MRIRFFFIDWSYQVNTKKIIGFFFGAFLFFSSSFMVKAGCDEMADKNLQVADGMTPDQIRKLIKSAASSVGDGIEQASNTSK